MKTSPLPPHIRDLKDDANEIADVIRKTLNHASHQSGKNEIFKVQEVHYHKTANGTQHLDIEMSLNGEDYAGGSYSLAMDNGRILVINDALKDWNCTEGSWGVAYGYLQYNGNYENSNWVMLMDRDQVANFNYQG